MPIVTFINKLDRHGREPMDLLDEIERVLDMPCSPINWPIGSGPEFQGVYDRASHQLLRFERGASAAHKAAMQVASIDDPTLRQTIGAHAHQQLLDEIALLQGAGTGFDLETFRAGMVSPVFFGSALTNFGIEPFLDRFLELAPSPLPRHSVAGDVDPEAPFFSGFVFKIQANMDPQHRDRVAFVRVCSGRFERGMDVTHVRTGKPLSLNKSMQLRAQERTLIDEAFAGDIIGLWDPGVLRIGDTISERRDIEYDGIPRFSPERFVRVVLTEPFKRKQLKKGLDQLSEEGVVQVFFDRHRLEREPILGAVGQLQFDVVEARFLQEYNVRTRSSPLPYVAARWPQATVEQVRKLPALGSGTILATDQNDKLVCLFTSAWAMQRLIDENPSIHFGETG
jgi:peptide chain release factor 3